MARRRRRADPVTAPDLHAIPDAIAIGHALAPLDEVARQMEAKWGVERLPGLVSTETAARFGSATEKLERAIEANDLTEIKTRAPILIRGWQALDREATEAGAAPLPKEAWAFEVFGRPAAVVANRASARLVQEIQPESAVYTLEEVGRLIEAATERLAPMVAEAKRAFPGAEVVAVRRAEFREDEDLPF